MTATLVTLALLAGLSVPRAIEDVRPGDGIVDGTRIRPYTNRWGYYRVDADGTRHRLGEWRDELQVTEIGGRTVIHRVQEVPAPGGRVRKMLNIVDRDTLAPIRTTFELVGDPPYLDVEFDSAGFRGVRRLQPEGADALLPARIEVSLDRPVFDWSLWGVLIAGFPLREGYEASFTAFGPAPRGRLLIEVSFRVTGREAIELGGGRTVDCWVVALRELAPWTLWIATDRGLPPVVQIDIEVGDGAHLRWEPPPSGSPPARARQE